MTVTGLNSDLYYSDNPNYITFSQINVKTKYIEYFPQDGGVDPIQIYTAGRSEISVDIAEFVKLLFPDVTHNTDYTTLTPFAVANNWLKVSFIIKEVYKSGQEVYAPTLTKTFARGGNRTYTSNQRTAVKTALIPTDTIPQWGGYPIDYYYFDTSKQIFKSNVIPPTIKEIRKVKGCEPLYVKFRNSKAGYSYWLFESWEQEYQNKNLGTMEQRISLIDLGNENETTITAISKVPSRYFTIIRDLISSGEIYIYKGNTIWERVTSDNNKASQNLFNQNEKVKIKLQTHHRYNPSLLW